MADEGWGTWLAAEHPDEYYLGLLNLLTKHSSRFKGMGSNFADYWRQKYGDIYKDFQGRQAAQVIGGGGLSGLTWDKYLAQNYIAPGQGKGFFAEWNKLAPWTKGWGQKTPVRWNIPW